MPRAPAELLAWERPGGEEGAAGGAGTQRRGVRGRSATLPLGRVVDSGGEGWRGGARWATPACPTSWTRAPSRLGRGAAAARPAQLAVARRRGLRRGRCTCGRRGVDPAILGEADRLDGARWLPPGHLLPRQIGARFRPIGESGPCTTPMRLLGRRTRPAAPDAQLCRIDEEGRAWGGLADLAASATRPRPGPDALPPDCASRILKTGIREMASSSGWAATATGRSRSGWRAIA
ncbi:MAG: hypothetical protein R3F43_15830 [bacterium]